MPRQASRVRRFPTLVFGAWAADVEMDGDIDVVVGAAKAAVRAAE